MKSWYQIKNRSNGSREIEISIMEEIGGWGISAKDFRNDLNHLGETEPIHVHINSDGGDIFAGNEIYNALLEHKGKVRVTVGALAASMASVIAMAGDEIAIAENGMLMIHDPWSIMMGDSEEFRKTADTLDDLKAGIVKAYQRQTNLSPAEISALMSDETWMTAEEAEQLGFVDSIISGDKGDTERAKNFNVARFQNSAAFRNQLEGNNKLKTKENLLNKGGNGEDPPSGENAVKEERARIAEIQSIADQVLKHDKKDFRAEARKAITEGVSPDEFAKAIINSDRFKSQFIVGSGEQGEGDDFGGRNSIGALVINHPEYRRMQAQGGLQKGQSIVLAFNDLNWGKMRRGMFRPRAATPLTGLPATGVDITPSVFPAPLMVPKVADLATPLTTNGSSVRYVQEGAFTNTADAVAEGAAKPEIVFAYTEVDSAVRKIAAWTKLSDEILADHERVANAVNVKMGLAVEAKLDTELVSGTGVAPHLLGLLNTAGLQTQARGADTQLDAIRKAITRIRLAFAEPDAVICHPTDQQTIDLLKDSAGQYLGGGPRGTGPYGVGTFNANAPIWGLPPVVTTSIPVGTVLVGSFRYAFEVYWRMGLTITLTNTDQDDFLKNLITIRAELRAAIAVPYASALCQVIGM